MSSFLFEKFRLLWQSSLSAIVLLLMIAVLFVGGFGFASPVFASSPLAQSRIPMPILAAGSLFSFSGKRPTTLGVTDGMLSPCPNSPNCVSSQSADSAHRIEPIPFKTTPEQAIANLKSVIQALPRTEIKTVRDRYLYAEFASALMGFVDDVEFYVEPSEKFIQVRSASRLGESDLGVNRKRIDTIRSKFSNLDFVS